MTPDNRIGIFSTNLAGTDGASLETAKLDRVPESLGYGCFYFTGKSDLPANQS
jgi:hypothetical protein